MKKRTRVGVALALSAALGLALFAGQTGFLDLGCSLPSMNSRALSAEDEQELEEFFSAKKIYRLDVEVSRAQLSELSLEPRDYVQARVSFLGRTFDKAGFRIKGGRSFRIMSGKPAFKIRLGKKKSPGLLGMSHLVLNNMVDDPTLMRETLAYRLHRDAHLLAPRTAYVEVFVNNEPYGLHLMVEPVAPMMIERQLGDGSGLLYEGEVSCDLFQTHINGMQEKLGKDPDREKLTDLVLALDSRQGPFLQEMSSLLDQKRIVSFLAMSQILGDFDGYHHAHNYFAYFNPTDEKWSLSSFGLDQTFDEHIDLFDSGGRLAEECWEDEPCRLAYVKEVHRLLDRFEEFDLLSQVEELKRLIEPAIKRDFRLSTDQEERNDAMAHLRAFIKDRPEELRKMATCWDGKKEVDADGDGYACMDCDDSDKSVHPGAPELCNDQDDNCSGHVDDAASCSCKEVQIGGAVFHLCKHYMDFEEAKRFCQSRNERLAWIDSVEQGDELRLAAHEVRKRDWFIGIEDRDDEGRYTWLDGEPVDSKMWADREPDIFSCGQECGGLNTYDDGYVSDVPCMQRTPFICRSLSDASSEGDDEAGEEDDEAGEEDDDANNAVESSSSSHESREIRAQPE